MSESVYKVYLGTYGQTMTGGVVFIASDLSLQEAHAAAQGVHDGRNNIDLRSRQNVEAQVTAALLMPDSAGSAP